LCASCPIAKVADIIGDPCSLLLIRDLLDGAKRFGELDESLGMSTRTLTKTLRRLEESGFIARKGLEYSLTAKGRGLKKVIGEMRTYGKRYL
ncbi:MAG TPA: helix-turn-helix domain-containing protein, partial [Candidatus Paceibacterota bacterium]|nr:helix-turn-helix domain-containing protein [Candidatus Paceibacterota bacterium]